MEYIGTYLMADKILWSEDETLHFTCSKNKKDYILYTAEKQTNDNSTKVILTRLAVKVDIIEEDDEYMWMYDLFEYSKIADCLIELKDKVDIIVDEISLNRLKYVRHKPNKQN